MKIKYLRFLGLLLAALTVGMKLAHVLELYPKLQWEAELYFPVQTSLYKLFGILGPVVDVGAMLSIGILAATLRNQKHKSFAFTLASLVSMLFSIIVWIVIVAPSNSHINEWLVTHTTPADWTNWRNRWQFGQAGSFLFDLVGFILLLVSVIKDTPD